MTPGDGTHTSFCRICEALCGLELDVQGGRVEAIRPDAAHVATRGFACMKGLAQHRLYDSPDRLRHPMKRTPGGHARASWDEAVRSIGTSVRGIVREHGPDAVAMYVGTAAGFGVLHPIFAQGFMDAIGSRSMYSSATQDCSNKFAVARHVYGFPFTQPFPDVERTRCLVIVGANPVVSKWSFLQVSDPIDRLRAIERRGGRVFVVDPRRTETAKAAGTHVFIRPGTDVFFFLSFLHELFASGGVDRARAARHVAGLEEVEKLVAAWPAERTAPVTRIAPGTLREIVEAYRTAGGAALYSSTGVNMGGHGALAFWLQECANALSGNLDRAGGTLVGEGVIDFPAFASKRGILMKEGRSRVGDYAQVNDAFPGGLLADEILTPGRGQVRALFVTGGNPLLTMPNAARLAEALRSLELLVVLDVLPTETASLAHWMLPCTSPLERPDLPFVFPLMLGLQSRPYLQATRALVPPPGEARDEASIYLDLARACSERGIFGSRVAQRVLDGLRAWHGWRRPAEKGALPQEALLSALLRATRQGSFGALLREPHGRARPEHRPGSFLGKRVLTADGRVQLAPPPLLAAARGLDTAFEHERASDDRLRLITKRQVQTHNSWTHNFEKFAQKSGGTNHLYVHPDDAARLGLVEGALADVTSATASVRVPVKLLDDLQPGTVALPHGWGHQRARGLSVASRTRGVNVNLLAADGPAHLERTSGMARLTGIPVEVRPATGPQDPTSWSGLPEA